MRIALAFAGLLITAIDPSQQAAQAGQTFAVLAAYTLYSIVIYVVAWYPRLQNGPARWTYWIDLAWYTVLIACSQGTSSIFFFGFFFAILTASFGGGFGPGIQVALASALIFTTIGLATQLPEGGPEFDRFLIRPVFLLVLGYMIARWGGHHTTTNRRLALLREVASISNPRFGIDHTVGSFMEKLRNFFRADTCLVVASSRPDGTYQMQESSAAEPDGGAHSRELSAPIADLLLGLPPDEPLLYRARSHSWERLWPSSGGRSADPPARGDYVAATSERAGRIAATLGAHSFISAPMSLGREARGRIYLLSAHRSFQPGDDDYLSQVVEQFTPVLENIRLVDRLASDAAEAERLRIARDLHDSIIQPYIGLQLGLNALRSKASPESNICDEIDRLLLLTEGGISELRGYVGGLRGTQTRQSALVPAVQRFARKFADATGIDVEVEPQGQIRLNDRLAAEAFQMVSEGLSNVRRHTRATFARVCLSERNSTFVLSIENPYEIGEPPPPFVPRSISERAAALGGTARANHRRDGFTEICVDIPL